MLDSVVDGLSSALIDVTRPDHLQRHYSKLAADFKNLKVCAHERKKDVYEHSREIWTLQFWVLFQ